MTEELKTKIQKLIEEKHFEEAIKLCDEAIEKDDKDEDAYFQKASCYFELKDYNTAIENLNKIIELNPNNEKAYFNRAFLNSILEIYEKAREDYIIVSELNPNNVDAYFNIGNCNFHLKEYLNAIEYYEKSLELNPDIKRAYLYIAECLLKLKNYEEAIKYLDKTIELDNKYEDAYFKRGLLKFNLEKYEESIEDFDKAIELSPTHQNSYLSRGISKLNLQRYEESIEDFNKLIEMNPKNPDVYVSKGIAEIYLKKYEESIKNFNKSIELNQNNGKAYLDRGVVKSILGKYEEAIKDFDMAIEINPYYTSAYFNRGIIKLKLRIYESSIEDFTKIVGTNPYSFLYINKDNNIYINTYIIKILQLFEEYEDIDKLFKFIVDIKNNELWENEPITNLISRFDESKNFDDELRKNIKYLILYEYFLLKILTFDTEEEENNNIEISHYTSLDILTLLLNPKEEKTNKKENTKESGNIRINNITTANDPKEGKILERILNKNNIDIKIENDEKALTLQTSYSRNKDSLTMFRLYGKKENKEATGVCLVLDNKYFNNSYTSPYSYELKLKIENNKIEMNEKINKEKFQENKRNLYWVLYYNEKENQLIYNKEKSKYASNIIDLNDLNNDDYKAELKEDDKKEGMIKYAFAKIFYYIKEIKKQIEDPKNNENYKNIKNQLYSYLFENIKYIIKHEAFFEEQELRMLVTNDYKSDEILIDNDNKKLYIDYIKLFDEKSNYIKEIIIGSKVENNEAVAEYIRKVLHSKNTEMNKLDDIKVSISEAPLR